MTEKESVTILLVEDNEDDVFFIIEALGGNAGNRRIFSLKDGVEAMQYLRNEDPDGEYPRPDLILLDLNMPRKDGREVLIEIKQDPNLKSIPVVILTTSNAEDDIKSSYEHAANSYITKPFGLNDFRAVMLSLREFWIDTACLPN